MVRRLKFRPIGKDVTPPQQFVSDHEYDPIDPREWIGKPFNPNEFKGKIKSSDPIDPREWIGKPFDLNAFRDD